MPDNSGSSLGGLIDGLLGLFKSNGASNDPNDPSYGWAGTNYDASTGNPQNSGSKFGSWLDEVFKTVVNSVNTATGNINLPEIKTESQVKVDQKTMMMIGGI